MKKALTYLIISLLFIAVTATTGCRNKSKTTIIGTWKQIPYTKPDGYYTYWTFSAANDLEVKTETKDSIYVRTYIYDIARRDLTISDDGNNYAYANTQNEPRGKYYIHHLGKDICKIEKIENGNPSGAYNYTPYLMIELVKQ